MKLILTIASLCAFAAAALADERGPAIATVDKNLQEQVASMNSQYLVFSPDKKPDGKLPLVIYLHGAGGVGENIRKITGQASAIWQGIEKFDKGPCLLVAPQCLKRGRAGGGWQAEELDVFLEQLKKTLPIDEKRIYLTGNSMGGMGSWMWGGHSPQHFAAVAPVSGGIGAGGPKDVTPNLDKWVANLAQVPVYAFVGAEDQIVPAERSERMIAAIRKAGSQDAQIKIYPKQGHNARSVVYSTAEFYDWLFAQRRE